MQKLNKLGQLAAVAALAAGVSLPASALSIDFTSSSAQQTGSSVTYTHPNVSVEAKGFADTGTHHKLEAAEVTKWSTGLGVCNTLETASLGGCDSLTEHQVDNYFYTDVIAFFFDQSVSFDSVTVDPYGIRDRDISYWVGDLSTTSLAGTSYGDYDFTHENGSWSSSALTYGLSGAGNTLLVSASLINGLDAFKLKSISVADAGLGEDVTPVPLPAAAWLMMSGLAAYGFTARKRKANA